LEVEGDAPGLAAGRVAHEGEFPTLGVGDEPVLREAGEVVGELLRGHGLVMRLTIDAQSALPMSQAAQMSR
jgi:hypothetical protein